MLLKIPLGQYLPWWSHTSHLQSLCSLQEGKKKALKFLSHYMLFLQNSDTSCNSSNCT